MQPSAVVRSRLVLIFPFLLLWGLFTGCGETAQANPSSVPLSSVQPDSVPTACSPSSLASTSKSVPHSQPPQKVYRPVLQQPPCLPKPDGLQLLGGICSSIDASHVDDGYVMVNYTGSNHKPRMIVSTPTGIEYRYYLHQNVGYQSFPLTQGSGTYTLSILENAGGNSYYLAEAVSFSANLADDHTLYLYPNQFVDFQADSLTVTQGRKLAEQCETDLDVVDKVFHYTMDKLEYDDQKAATVKSGYVPDVDAILESGTGICFDYASVMATMLRSQGIPTKLEVGNARNPYDAANPIYHAWISVYTDEQGWIDGYIQFHGNAWRMMDPTFADDMEGREDFMQEYLAEETNYTVIYEY